MIAYRVGIEIKAEFVPLASSFLPVLLPSFLSSLSLDPQAYYQSLRRVQLSGPTLFQAVINQAAQIANSTKHHNPVRKGRVAVAVPCKRAAVAERYRRRCCGFMSCCPSVSSGRLFPPWTPAGHVSAPPVFSAPEVRPCTEEKALTYAAAVISSAGSVVRAGARFERLIPSDFC